MSINLINGIMTGTYPWLPLRVSRWVPWVECSSPPPQCKVCWHGHWYRIAWCHGYAHGQTRQTSHLRDDRWPEQWRSTCSYGLKGKDHLTHRSHGNSLDVSDSGWTSKYADISRKWWLQARFTSLPFEALNQCLQVHANFLNMSYEATV